MLKIAFGQQKNQKKPIMVGLAAPQIGILKRIILVDIKANGKGPLRERSGARTMGDLQVFINPKIIWESKTKEEWYEGCFSTGNVCGIVSRPVALTINAFVLKSAGVNTNPPQGWTVVTEKYTGYVARIFQHEIDHLDGKVFVDHIKDPEKLHWVLAKEFKKYRKSFQTWPNKCSFAKWQKIKRLVVQKSAVRL